MSTDTLTWVARWRVPLGFLAGVVVLWLAHPTTQSLLAGGLIACAGEALRIWAAGHLNKSREVTASGPYQWLSHPLYAGSSVMAIGLALASRSFAVAVIVGLYVGVTFTAAVRTEERTLRAKFGDAYDRYQGGSVDAARPFSWARAIENGEHRAMAGVVLAWAALLARSMIDV